MRITAKAREFEAALSPHVDAAYNLARWLTRDPQDAEDCVQDAFLRAFRFFDGFRGGAGSPNFRPWLLRIVRNTCYTWLRRNDTHVPVALDEEFVNPASHAEGAAPFEAANPEAQLLRIADRQGLDAALAQLPPEFREALLLREFEEMSYKQIADITEVPIGTVMSRLARARTRLRALLSAPAQVHA